MRQDRKARNRKREARGKEIGTNTLAKLRQRELVELRLSDWCVCVYANLLIPRRFKTFRIIFRIIYQILCKMEFRSRCCWVRHRRRCTDERYGIRERLKEHEAQRQIASFVSTLTAINIRRCGSECRINVLYNLYSGLSSTLHVLSASKTHAPLSHAIRSADWLSDCVKVSVCKCASHSLFDMFKSQNFYLIDIFLHDFRAKMSS